MENLLTPELVGIGIVAVCAGWVATTWLRIRNGYPLENSWGKSVYPKNDQAVERVKLLTQENAALQAELGSLKDRLANVERIVTDSGYQLHREFEALEASDRKEAN